MTARKQNENLGGAKLELNKKSRRILTKRKRNVCTCMEHNKHKNRHKPKNPKRIRDLVENSPFGHSRAPPKRFKTPQNSSKLISTRENSLFGHSRAPPKRLKTLQNSSELLSTRENLTPKGVAYAWDMTFASGFTKVEFCAAVLGFQLNLSPCQKHGFRQRDFHVFGSDIGEIRCNGRTHR